MTPAQPEELQMADICCLLIGLPAAGKSTLCERLLAEPIKRLDLTHIDYDRLLPTATTSGAKWTDPSHVWKSERTAVQQRVQQIFLTPSSRRRCLLVDDNFYYSSMRVAFYKMCRVQRLAFGQIYLATSVELAQQRNAQRTGAARVPDAVIQRMANRFEPPDPAARHWERDTLVLSSEHVDQTDLNRIVSFLEKLEAAPAPDPSNEEEQARSQQQTRASVKHQLDLTIRDCVSQLINESAGDITRIQRIVAVKKQLLKDFQTGSLNCEEPRAQRHELLALISDMVNL